MLRNAILPVATIAIVLGALGIVRVDPAQTASRSFTETFDGVPLSPEPFSSPHWDLQVHERGMVHHEAGWLPAVQAQHGPGCEGPEVTHTVDSTDEAVFRCRDHMMTTIWGPEYGVIYLTPDQMVDWSGGKAVVEFSMSTKRMSARDWLDIWVTPWNDNMALPFTSTTPDLQGPPSQYLRVGMDAGFPSSAPSLNVRRPGAAPEKFSGYVPALAAKIPADVDQSRVRQPFRLTITPTSAKFERLASPTAPGLVYWERTFAELPFSSGVVQFGHHSYNPTKDGAGVPGTHHWDDFHIEPAIPFRMDDVTPRYLQTNTKTPVVNTVTFPPAPSNAYLRFSATRGVKVNGVLAQPQVKTANTLMTQSYFVPIPAGSTSATIESVPLGKFDCGYGCLVKDLAVWSSSTESLPVKTPTTTGASPTVSATPSASVSATPSRTAVATSTPTAKPSATPTTSPAPAYGLTVAPSPSSVVRGELVTGRISATANLAASALIDVEVVDPAGKIVYEQKGISMKLTANKTVAISASWKAPSTAVKGVYTIRVKATFKATTAPSYLATATATFTVR